MKMTKFAYRQVQTRAEIGDRIAQRSTCSPLLGTMSLIYNVPSNGARVL